MCFLMILAPFVITPTFDFGAIACTPRDFSSSRHVAKSQTKLQNIPKTGPEIQPKTTKTPLTNPSKDASDFGTFFTYEMKRK